MLSVLEYLKKHVAGTLKHDEATHLRYPTAISQTLGIRIVEIGVGCATLEIDADPEIHGNQQGTVHGGLICELADAAIGTAHSTVTAEGESFTSIVGPLRVVAPVRSRCIHQRRNLRTNRSQRARK